MLLGSTSHHLLLAGVLCAALAPVAVSSAPAVAAPALTGTVLDATTGNPVAGAVVRLRTRTPAGLGTVVDTDVTAAGGGFALSGSAGADYYVQLVADRYQFGVAGGSPEYFQANLENADLYSAGDALGAVFANPAFIRGVVVDSVTKKPVRGARVVARQQDTAGIEAADLTARNGRFELTGITFEDDGYLKVNGADIGYEVGFVTCFKKVVPSFGQACASPLGVITTPIKLDKD